ncbi:MAG: hypothetical protein GTO41_19835 [Burkholderiales bacterium]|nr:hypothetical protein [Burkholderiales bacterium]
MKLWVEIAGQGPINRSILIHPVSIDDKMKPELTQHEDGRQPQPAYVEHYVSLGEKLGLVLLKTGALTGTLARRLAAAVARGQQQGTQLRASSTLDMARRQQRAVHTHEARKPAANDDQYKSAA